MGSPSQSAETRRSTLVRQAAQASVALLFGLRVYALFFTVHAVAWDDQWFRWYAQGAAARTSLPGALAGVLLPNATNLEGERSVGYHSWLVLSEKLLPALASETAFHLLNLGFLAAQVTLLYRLALRATARRDFAWLCAFAYLSSPIVFGINRWLMTENHVMTCVLALSSGAFWLLDRGRDAGRDAGRHRGEPVARPIRWREDLAAPAAVAYLFGVCSTLREYAVPSFAAMSLAVVLGLLLQRRRLGAAVFALVLAPFVAAMFTALPPVFRTALGKSAIRLYFHPMTSWLPHFVVFVAGIALTAFVVQLAAPALRELAREVRRRSALRRPDPLLVLIAAHFSLVLVYAAVILHSANRVVRPGIPPLLTLLCGLLITLRWLGARGREATRITPARAALVPVAWAFLVFELFFAFHGGRDYAMHPYPLERYDHPLFLRPLRDDYDMHVIPAKPYWQQDPNDIPPDPYGWF